MLLDLLGMATTPAIESAAPWFGMTAEPLPWRFFYQPTIYLPI
jgi:hypothetical protein